MQDPRPVYAQLLEQRRADIARRELRHRMLGYCQLVMAACGVAIVAASLLYQALSILWAVVPVVAVITLAVIHDHLLRLLERRRRAERYFEKALARLDGNWTGTGEAGDRYLDPAHPYAQDLDLFGKGSLFELLSTARTHIGEDTLARWLLAPADPETVRARNDAVNELRPRLDLREELAVVAEEARTGVDPVSLAAWGEAQPLLGRRWFGVGLRTAAIALTVLGALAGVAFVVYLVQQSGLIELSAPAVVRLRAFFLLVILVNAVF